MQEIKSTCVPLRATIANKVLAHTALPVWRMAGQVESSGKGAMARTAKAGELEIVTNLGCVEGVRRTSIRAICKGRAAKAGWTL
jgi:hypothetical protein